MTSKTTTVGIKNIYLDLNNPRYVEQKSESDAINYLVSNEDIKQLAKNIAEIGGTSPIELMALVPHPKVKNSYVTAEGNRRLCALKLLLDPDKAKNKKDKDYFKKLKDGMKSKITDIPAIIFASFELARPWVELRHDPQTGVGAKRWDATQKGRFNQGGRADTPNSTAINLIDYAKEHKLVSDDVLNNIQITTLTRFLSTPDVRSAIGLASPKGIQINVEDKEFNTALTKFLEDAADSSGTITSRANAEDRKLYAENLRKGGFSPKNRGVAIHVPGVQISTGTPAALRLASTNKKSATHPSKRNQLIPSSFVVQFKDNVLLRLVSEGKKAHPDDAPFSCNYLNRVILERIVHLYAKQHGVGANGDFSAVVSRVIDHASKSDSPPTKGISNTLTKTSNKSASYSYEIMSNPIHGGSIPTGKDNRSNWETLQPALEYLLSELK